MAHPTKKPDLKQRRMQLRVPSDVYERVHDLAEDESRTLNATVTLLLREALDARAHPRRAPRLR